MTALMGAHSFGRIHYYTGGPRTRNKGAGFCRDFNKIQGFMSNGTLLHPFTDETKHLTPESHPNGTCSRSDVTSDGGPSCWRTGEDGDLKPSRSWDGGAYWDRTPDKFD